jgi:hypothetical protein
MLPQLAVREQQSIVLLQPKRRKTVNRIRHLHEESNSANGLTNTVTHVRADGTNGPAVATINSVNVSRQREAVKADHLMFAKGGERHEAHRGRNHNSLDKLSYARLPAATASS